MLIRDNYIKRTLFPVDQKWNFIQINPRCVEWQVFPCVLAPTSCIWIPTFISIHAKWAREREIFFQLFKKILFAHDDNNYNIGAIMMRKVYVWNFCSIQQTIHWIFTARTSQQLYLVLTTCSRDLFWKRVWANETSKAVWGSAN